MKKKEVIKTMEKMYEESNHFLYLIEEYKKFNESVSKKDKKKLFKSKKIKDLNFKIQYIATAILEEIEVK